MANVFISYKRVDREWAERVDAALRSAGLTTWWDTSLVAGEQFTDAIRRELAQADAVVVLWSQDSFASRWVQAEAATALEHDKLVAARLDNVAVELPFNTVQTADLRSNDGIERLLAGVLRKVPAGVRTATGPAFPVATVAAVAAPAITPASSELETSPEKMRLVITASAAGTVFEWYDFFVYGALTSIMAANFFSNLPDAQALIFSLLAFSIGLIVRPIGALVFGKIGDSAGRKGAFLITISVMGLATFAIGLLPTQKQVPEAMILLPPVLLIGMRVLQGFALGGEYGGAAIYVAEHARRDNRGASTAFIQSAAAFGLVGALGVILATRTILGEEAFREWGWRVPFLVSIGLLAISVWIRMKLEESPAFKKLKEENATTKRAYAESFLEWRNLKIILLALFGLMMAQGVSWYTSHFYTQIFLERTLKVEQKTVNELLIAIVLISAPMYVFFAWLSDKVGRRPIMLFGMVLFAIACIPGFHLLSRAANPALDAATASSPAIVIADPADCTFQLDLTGGAQQFATSCDIAKGALTSAGVNYTNRAGQPGQTARIQIGDAVALDSVSAVGKAPSEVKAVRAAFDKELRVALNAAGYPPKADASQFDFLLALAVLFVLVLAATSLYGPQAAALVELFPTRIRYTGLSVPYNIGTGVFGGLLPPIVFAISTATGNIYAGLWFPVIVTAIAAVIFFFMWPETKDRDIHAM